MEIKFQIVTTEAFSLFTVGTVYVRRRGTGRRRVVDMVDNGDNQITHNKNSEIMK